MAELSPAAQAVLDAFLGVPILLNDQQERIALAAALRAAADQVVPEENVDEADYDCLHAKWAAEGKQETRADLLAIAADLLERLAAPVPVASDVYFEFAVSDADYCTQAGGIAPTYAQALSEGQNYLSQYQQDGPHTLEVRRVEVLPLPSGEVEA